MKTTFSFDEPAVEVLSNLAGKKKISKAEVIRRALMLYNFVDGHSGSERSITVKDEGGKEYLVLVP